MIKSKFIEMGYIKLDNGEQDTLYKKFDNANMFIVQFNEDVQENEIGMVYLTKEQIQELLKEELK